MIQSKTKFSFQCHTCNKVYKKCCCSETLNLKFPSNWTSNYPTSSESDMPESHY